MTNSIEDKLKKIYDDFFLYKKINNSNGNNNVINNNDIEKKLKYLYDEFIKNIDSKNIDSSNGLVQVIPGPNGMTGPFGYTGLTGYTGLIGSTGMTGPVNPSGVNSIGPQNIQTETGNVDIISSTINFTKNGDKLDSSVKLSEKTVLTLDNQKRNVIEKETTKL